MLRTGSQGESGGKQSVPSEIVSPVTDGAPPGRKGLQLTQSRFPFAKTPPGRGSFTSNQPPTTRTGNPGAESQARRTLGSVAEAEPGPGRIPTSRRRLASETLQTAVTGKDSLGNKHLCRAAPHRKGLPVHASQSSRTRRRTRCRPRPDQPPKRESAVHRCVWVLGSSVHRSQSGDVSLDVAQNPYSV